MNTVLTCKPFPLLPLSSLCLDIIRGYVILDAETQQRNIAAWQPVVVDVMEQYTSIPEKDFERNIPQMYPVIIELLNRELSSDMRIALLNMLRRAGEVRMGMGAGEKSEKENGDVLGGGTVKGRVRAASVISGTTPQVTRRGSGK